MLAKLILAACLVGLGSSFLFKQKKWSGLSVKFGINLFNSDNFDDLPRKESEAKSDGWTKIADCDESSKFRGKRYVKDNDYAVVMLYDKQGYVAGIQCGIAKADLPDDFPPPKQRGHMFQDDGDHYTLTAYFVDPDTICKAGRTAEEFDRYGTGQGLYLQNGSDPVSQSINIPRLQFAVAKTSWKLGHCFPAMGDHYWYNLTADMNCDDFQPVFLLYNEALLTGFGWALGVDLASRRYEHPPHKSFFLFLKPVPRCLSNYERLSTMHIYLTAHPTLNLC